MWYAQLVYETANKSAHRITDCLLHNGRPPRKFMVRRLHLDSLIQIPFLQRIGVSQKHYRVAWLLLLHTNLKSAENKVATASNSLHYHTRSLSAMW